MFDAATMLYLYAETPLHAGVGSTLSAVDLPIQRERATQYPMIQGSGIKGKLRAVAEAQEMKHLLAIFGPDTNHAEDYASALVVSDARILLFPVRSLAGVYAYVTSACVLSRFKRDFERDGRTLGWPDVPTVPKEQAMVSSETGVLLDGQQIMLEEFSYPASFNADLSTIAGWIADHALPDSYDYWKQKMRESLVLLPESDFRDFALHATEIITRVSLNRATKTVDKDKGALWTEEHLPAESLLYTPIYAMATRNTEGEKLSAQEVVAAVQGLKGHYLQLGGDETVGRGIVRITWQSNKEATQ